MLLVNLLAKPMNDLREAVKEEIESNPAIEDVDFTPFYRRGISVSSASAADALENMAAKKESLEEHLLRELRLSEVEDDLRGLCELVIGDLDESGRFTGSDADLAMVSGKNTRDVEKARQFVMTLDPLGCGARTTEECLVAQLSKIPAKDRDACRKVIDQLDDVRRGEVSVDALGAELAVFRKYRGRLVANPGEGFAPKRVEAVVPDIEVNRKGDVYVEMGDVPEINVSPKYLQMSKDRSLDTETRHYAQERIRHALDFAKAVERRQEVLAKIADVTVKAQLEYFTNSKGSLKPLTMTEVAKEAGCDVATVSRAAHRKFVKTPRGVLPLRKFFSVVDGGMVDKLREILSKKENAGLSDAKVAALMEKAGYKMARRTVNKYRTKLRTL